MTGRTSDEGRWRLGSLFLIAATAGIATGLAEASFLQTQRLFLDRMVFMGRHAWWMKPAAEALVFLFVTAACLGMSRLIPALRSPRVLLPVLGVLGAFSLLLMISGLHGVARLVLALGVGVQVGRVVAGYLEPREALSRRISFGAIAMLPLLALGGFVGRGGAATGPASAEGTAPNVLLLVLDTVRARSLSAFGHVRPTTPVLERIASEGLLFERAISPAPWTLPSHASLFTGFQPHELSVSWRVPLDDERATLAEVLSSAGYATGGFVANLAYASWESGLARGFQRYEDHPISVRQLAVESSMVGWMLARGLSFKLLGRDENLVRKDAATVNRQFLDWLEGQDDRPFFAFLNYYDAHGPYQPPEPYRSQFAAGEPRGPVSPLHRWLEDPFTDVPDDTAVLREERAYEAAIAALDAEIGRLLEALAERGALDNTILIITSDHGEEFGEYGAYDHGNSMYIDGLHVPLIIRWPGRLPAGGRIGAPVSLRSIPATIAALLGLDDTFPGASLVDSSDWSADLSGQPPVVAEVEQGIRLPDWFPVSRGDMASLTDEDWHLIRNGDGRLELYPLAEVPGQARDVAEDPTLSVLRDSLASRLEAAVGGR